MDGHVLSWMTFFPVVGMAAITLLPRERHNLIRWAAVVATAVPLILAVQVFVQYDRTLVGVDDYRTFQFKEQAPWIPSFGIDYFMGIDGISVTMVLLTALLSFLCIFASWGITKGVKGYMAMFLLLETGMMGVFCALNFFLFYVFWEVMLLPMYFLIGVWGGPRRVYAAIKFFLYTLFGSVLMLLAMLALYYHSDPHTLNIVELAGANSFAGDTLTIFGKVFDFSRLIWIALFIGFAIKVPIFPFHTWLPDAHVEAPTAVSVILAGVLLKMGTYGILRISYPILPESALWFAKPLAILAVINIIYGALCALAQRDLKKLVAYSSISHMGFVLLGMSAFTDQGIQGAVLQMFNHGTITAMLFLIVGVIYDRAHHREIAKFGGLGHQMPVYSGITGLAFMAALGLPGLSGFVSEFLVLNGAFDRWRTFTALGATGVVLGAGYMLWTYQRMFFGAMPEKYKDLPDITGRELFTLVPLAVIVVILGFYPLPILNLMSASLTHLLAIVSVP